MGNVIGCAAADEIGIDVLVTSFCELRQIFCANHGGGFLISRNIRGDGNVVAVVGDGKLHHAGHDIRHGIGFPYLKGGQIGPQDGRTAGDAGDKIDIAAVNGEGAHVSVRKGLCFADLGEVHPGVAGIVAAQIHLAVHGAPYIKSVRGGVIDNIVRAVSNLIQRLGVVENAFLFSKTRDTVSLCVIHQIYGAVAGNGMSFVNLVSQNLPVGQGIGEIVVVDHLIVVTVHKKPGIVCFCYIGGDAQIGKRILGNGFGGNRREVCPFHIQYQIKGPQMFCARELRRSVSAGSVRTGGRFRVGGCGGGIRSAGRKQKGRQGKRQGEDKG